MGFGSQISAVMVERAYITIRATALFNLQNL